VEHDPNETPIFELIRDVVRRNQKISDSDLLEKLRLKGEYLTKKAVKLRRDRLPLWEAINRP
jgi:hypothetical protein